MDSTGTHQWQEKNIFRGGLCDTAAIATFQPISAGLVQVTGSFGNCTEICRNKNELSVGLLVFYVAFFFPRVSPQTNGISPAAPYLLLILHDVAGEFKHELILLYHCCHNNAFPALSSTYEEKRSPNVKGWGAAPRASGAERQEPNQGPLLVFLHHQRSQVLLFSKGNKPREILSWGGFPTWAAFYLWGEKEREKKSYN